MEEIATNIIFATERLAIRRYTMDDLAEFYSMNGDEEVMRFIRTPQTLEQSTEFLAKIIKDYDEHPGRGRWYMFTKNDRKFVGSFAIIPVENSEKWQLGYALLKTNWGKGYASEVVKAGIDYAFNRLGFVEIAAITYTGNIASQKVLLKNGFYLNNTFVEAGHEMNLYIVTS
jgi:ribosomal-protein-alanine N-acetyltransferase